MITLRGGVGGWETREGEGNGRNHNERGGLEVKFDTFRGGCCAFFIPFH